MALSVLSASQPPLLLLSPRGPAISSNFQTLTFLRCEEQPRTKQATKEKAVARQLPLPPWLPIEEAGDRGKTSLRRSEGQGRQKRKEKKVVDNEDDDGIFCHVFERIEPARKPPPRKEEAVVRESLVPEQWKAVQERMKRSKREIKKECMEKEKAEALRRTLERREDVVRRFVSGDVYFERKGRQDAEDLDRDEDVKKFPGEEGGGRAL